MKRCAGIPEKEGTRVTATTSTHPTVQPPLDGFYENQLCSLAPRELCEYRMDTNGFCEWPERQHRPPLDTPSRSVYPILQRPWRNDSGGMTAQASADYQSFASVNDCDLEDKFSRWAFQVSLADTAGLAQGYALLPALAERLGVSEAPSVPFGHLRSPWDPSHPGSASNLTAQRLCGLLGAGALGPGRP